MPRYGPFHRLLSATQTRDDAARQIAPGEMWGKAPRQSAIPQVQAYLGPLPAEAYGIEFYTEVDSDRGTVFDKPRWTGPRPGVRIEDDFAKIAIVVSRSSP